MEMGGCGMYTYTRLRRWNVAQMGAISRNTANIYFLIAAVNVYTVHVHGFSDE